MLMYEPVSLSSSYLESLKIIIFLKRGKTISQLNFIYWLIKIITLKKSFRLLLSKTHKNFLLGVTYVCIYVCICR